MEVKNEIIHSLDADYSETRLLTASSDRTVRLYKINDTDMTPLSEYSDFPGPVTQAIFIDKGEMFCVSCYTGELIIYKLEGNSYTKKYEKKLFEGSVNSICHNFCESSFKIYCGCSDGNLREIEFDSKFNVKERILFCHRFGITSVSCNEKYILTGGVDYCSMLVNINDLSEVKRFNDHTGFVRQVGICSIGEFDISCFATCSDDGKVIIYFKEEENNYKKQVIEINEPVYSVSWSKMGYSLTVGYGDSGVKSFGPDASGVFKEIEFVKKD